MFRVVILVIAKTIDIDWCFEVRTSMVSLVSPFYIFFPMKIQCPFYPISYLFFFLPHLPSVVSLLSPCCCLDNYISECKCRAFIYLFIYLV